jgi:hypothetical protein
MSQSLIQIIREIEKQIPTYYTRPLENGFVGIYNSKNNKLTSVVSEKYVLIQSRDLFKEIIMNSFKDVHIIRYALETNLRKHYLYLRIEKEPYVEKFMVIMVNSVDKSNAVKILAGIFEQECGNDLVILSGMYFKHIKEQPLTYRLDLDKLFSIYRSLSLEPNNLDEEDVMKLRKVVYIDEKRKSNILQCPNKLEVYRYITSLISKKYNIAYFEKLNYLYNFLIKA